MQREDTRDCQSKIEVKGIYEATPNRRSKQLELKRGVDREDLIYGNKAELDPDTF